MTGIELIKAPDSTAGELADIISKPCPPSGTVECDRVSCRECWLAWLTTGEAAKQDMNAATTGKPLDLMRLRKLLSEVDAYFNGREQEKEPPDGWTAPVSSDELARLNKLLHEMDDYVSELSPGHTSR